MPNNVSSSSNCQCYEEEIDTFMKEHPSTDVLEFCKTLHDPDSLNLSISLNSTNVSPQPSSNNDEQTSQTLAEENSLKLVPVDGCETQLPGESENKDVNITPKDGLTIDAQAEPNDSANGGEALGEALPVLPNGSKEVS